MFPSTNYALLLSATVCIAVFTSVCGISSVNRTFISVSLAADGVNDSTCWTGGPAKPCSSLNLALEGVHSLSTPPNSLPVWIVLASAGNYPLTDSKHTNFVGSQIKDFGLIASVQTGNGDMPVIQCNPNNFIGFSFINVSGITLQNVIFNKCGSIQPSTSRKKSNESIF